MSRILEDVRTADSAETSAQIDADLAAVINLPKSVVGRAYKAKYAERAKEAKLPKGTDRRAVARSCGDWLALTLAGLCLDERRKLKVAEFEAILEANGIEHSHWNRTTKGWEGRLRMTGGLALRTAVAREELFFTPGAEPVVPPRSWIAKYQR